MFELLCSPDYVSNCFFCRVGSAADRSNPTELVAIISDGVSGTVFGGRRNICRKGVTNMIVPAGTKAKFEGTTISKKA